MKTEENLARHKVLASPSLIKFHKQHHDDDGTKKDYVRPAPDFMFDNECIHREVHVFFLQFSNMIIKCSKEAFLPQEIAIQNPKSDRREVRQVYKMRLTLTRC